VVGIFHQGNGGVAHLPQVKRADVGRHAHGYTLIGRNQHVGERGGQQRRLLHGGVVVVHHVHGVAVDVLEHLGADGIQLGLGVPGGGVGHVPGVHLTEVALGIHKGMQQRLIALGKTHHGLINGGIAVGVQAHGLADNIGGFRPSTGEQTHFVHGVQQLAVRRLEAIDLRNCPGNDHRHGIGHVVHVKRLCNRLIDHRAAQAHHIRPCRPMDGAFFCFFLCHRNRFLHCGTLFCLSPPICQRINAVFSLKSGQQLVFPLLTIFADFVIQ